MRDVKIAVMYWCQHTQNAAQNVLRMALLQRQAILKMVHRCCFTPLFLMGTTNIVGHYIS